MKTSTTQSIFKYLLFSLPILFFSLPLLMSGDKISPGDPDYMFQLYEAFRRSVLEFHQFPLWNAWVAGGIPLFANINFGLVSVATPFVLIFGSVMGIKISVVVLQLIGFFGYKKLFQDCFKASVWRAALLAYIAVFSSFFAQRIMAGHFNFLLIAFFPWLLIFFLQRSKHLSWLGFALFYSFMVWSSPHYITIMSMAVIGIWFGYELVVRLTVALRTKKSQTFFRSLKQDALFALKSGALIIGLTLYRMYFALSFIHDSPRLENASQEPFTGIHRGLYAIWGPDQYKTVPHLPTGWAWTEASTYIGIGTAVCLAIVISMYLLSIVHKQKKPFSYPLGILLLLFLTFFIIGMADFGKFSPYVLLNKLPIFNSMRVATRWLVWSSLCVLFMLASYTGKKFQKLINIILMATVIELFIINSPLIGMAYFVKLQQYRSPQANFNQESRYRVPRPAYAADPHFNTIYFYDENLLETTRNNYGQVIVGDSLVDTRQPNSTIRCGENQGGCQFISSNARVTSWTPNKLILERLAPGPINTNMNPGKGWRINGDYPFRGFKATDPKKGFIINDPSNKIIVEYVPVLSPKWILSKFKTGNVNVLVQELMFFHNITSVIQTTPAWKI